MITRMFLLTVGLKCLPKKKASPDLGKAVADLGLSTAPAVLLRFDISDIEDVKTHV